MRPLLIFGGCVLVVAVLYWARELVKAKGYRAVCIADLPPSPPSRSRYLVKRLRAALPDLKLIVGRWAPAALADETTEPLLEAGAAQVAASLQMRGHRPEDGGSSACRW